VIQRRAARWLVAVGGMLLSLGAHPADEGPLPPPVIHWRLSSSPITVEVDGLSRPVLTRLERDLRENGAGERVFPVFAEPLAPAATPAGGLPAMAGTWRVEEGYLRFRPSFPLVPGVRYRAEYRPTGEKPLVSSFEVLPPDATPTTSVVQVYPSGDVLPENQLKFYVEFSGPMSRGGTYEHVQLREEGGGVVELPFLELDEELWDPAMTRLTLLIDPGRIKRGVKPLEDIGPVFEAGKRYRLTFARACRDAAGRPLRAEFVKTFRIGEADRTPPDPRRWRVASPAAGTRDPLRVEFDEPMDQALALRLIGVEVGAERTTRIAGDATLTEQERGWSFVPAQPWIAGPHRLTVAPTIEDLAGNNIGKTFDVDLNAGAQRRVPGEAVTVSFVVQ
jgi:hypothetical protein